MPLLSREGNKQTVCRMCSLYTPELWGWFGLLCYCGSFFNGQINQCFKKQNIAKLLHIDSNQFHNTEPFSIGVSITVITVPGLILFIVPSGSTAACGFRQSSIWHRVTGGRNSTRRLLNCLLAKTCVGFLFSFPVVRLSPFMQIVNGSKDPCVEELQTSKWRHNLEQLMHFLPKWDDFLWSILISFYSFN